MFSLDFIVLELAASPVRIKLCFSKPSFIQRAFNKAQKVRKCVWKVFWLFVITMLVGDKSYIVKSVQFSWTGPHLIEKWICGLSSRQEGVCASGTADVDYHVPGWDGPHLSATSGNPIPPQPGTWFVYTLLNCRFVLFLQTSILQSSKGHQTNSK